MPKSLTSLWKEQRQSAHAIVNEIATYQKQRRPECPIATYNRFEFLQKLSFPSLLPLSQG